MGQPYRIITFDGGGVLGLFSIGLLQRLCGVFPELLDRTNLLAGTSTGGLISLCLARGLSPTQVMDLYLTRVRAIFARPLSHKLFTCWGLSGPKYDNAALIKVAYDTFGQDTFADLTKKVVVPAFDMESEGTPENPSWRARFFHNLDDGDINEKVADVAIRTASAPTYFPTYQGYCDGGVIANSPSLVALAQAVQKESVPLEDIRLLSIGTGGQIRYLQGDQLQWGALKWLQPILGIFMEGQALVSQSLSEKLLDDKYCRVDPICPGFAMDDVAKMPDILRMANDADLEFTLKWIKHVFLAD